MRTAIRTRRHRLICMALLSGFLASCDLLGGTGFDTQVPWQETGVELIFDPHTHTKFSDGALSLDAVVRAAMDGGCSALAITDHSDVTDRVATEAYFAAIDTARIAYPGIILVAGMELNIPPYEGREHLGVLVPRSLERRVLRPLMMFAEARPGADNSETTVGRDLGALKMLVLPVGDGESGPVVIYNHPSRRDKTASENLWDVKLWSVVRNVLVGFEGGPGHQKLENRGSYGPTFSTQDGWDPAVAEIGGTWDRLLLEGRNFWGALASSDYHNANMDYPPCVFSRTHVIAPERSISGLLRALRAGTFWADQGRILDELDVRLETENLRGAARPGDTIFAPRNEILRVSVNFKRGAGALGQPVIVEVMGNCGTGVPGLLHRVEVEPGHSAFEAGQVIAGAGPGQSSCFIRVRLTVETSNQGSLHAYSNPVRIRIPSL